MTLGKPDGKGLGPRVSVGLYVGCIDSDGDSDLCSDGGEVLGLSEGGEFVGTGEGSGESVGLLDVVGCSEMMLDGIGDGAKLGLCVGAGLAEGMLDGNGLGPRVSVGFDVGETDFVGVALGFPEGVDVVGTGEGAGDSVGK